MTGRRPQPTSTRTRTCTRVNLLDVCAVPVTVPLGEIRTPDQFVQVLDRIRLCNPSQEEVWVFGIDPHGRMVSAAQVHIGAVTHSIVSIPDVLKFVILSNVQRFILLHNHPTGTTNVSREDIALTGAVKKAAETVGLVLLDHIIWAGGSRYTSLMETGRM